jgi:hypothetical protein
MRFEVEHRFHGTPAEVAALLGDPGFYRDLVLPDVGTPTVLDHRTDGPRSWLSLRYEFTGDLNSVAQRLLGSRRLAWIQDVEVDTAANSGALKFSAAADPRRLHGSANFVLLAVDEGTVRRMTGELVVAVPLIGPRAERQIQPGLLRRLDIEAETLDRKLGAGT